MFESSRYTADMDDRRRLLDMLAGSTGCTEALLLAWGFKPALLAEVIGAGLATATTERVLAGGTEVEVTRIRITDRGRQAL